MVNKPLVLSFPPCISLWWSLMYVTHSKRVTTASRKPVMTVYSSKSGASVCVCLSKHLTALHPTLWWWERRHHVRGWSEGVMRALRWSMRLLLTFWLYVRRRIVFWTVGNWHQGQEALDTEGLLSCSSFNYSQLLNLMDLCIHRRYSLKSTLLSY